MNVYIDHLETVILILQDVTHRQLSGVMWCLSFFVGWLIKTPARDGVYLRDGSVDHLERVPVFFFVPFSSSRHTWAPEAGVL